MFWLLVTLAGVAVLGVAIGVAVTTTERTSEQLMLLAVLAIAALISATFPIKVGQGDLMLSLDGVPLVMAAVYLPWSDAVIVSVVVCFWALRALPKELGKKAAAPLMALDVSTSALAMAPTCLIAASLGLTEGITTVHLLSALALAICFEAVIDLLVIVAIGLQDRDAMRHVMAGMPATAGANVLLPTVALVALSPYMNVPIEGILLLGPTLFVMYFALWVANSQQLEKRRGQHMKDTFSRYIPEALVGQHFDLMQEVQLGGEQREISVLFCDIRGFTSWSENRDAQEIIGELNVLLGELSASVMGEDGTLDKYTGDGLMAFWGAPFPQEDHALRASNAALEMLRRLDVVNDKRHADGQEPFAIGVGVHSGLAVVGNVGHEKRLDYTAIGDTVNLAARLEAATKEIGSVLLLSSDTVERLPDESRERAMRIGDIKVKGRRAPVEVWALQPLRPELEGLDDAFAA